MKTPVLLVACLLPSAALAAPPSVTYLYPAGAQRGQTVDVTAGGTFERWPVQVWVDRPGVTVRPARDKGKLTVMVAPEAVPGTTWLRLYDDQGASAPRPFVVGTLPEVLEQEPNNDAKKPQVLDTSNVVVNGRLGQSEDVDCFAVKLRKGQTLVASMEANRLLGSPIDAVLQVVSADGFVLDENNDYHDLDPQIVFAAPRDGTYILRTFAFPATPDSTIRFTGSDAAVYRLTLTTGGFIDHAFPLAVRSSAPGKVTLHGWNIPDAAKQFAIEPGAHDEASAWHPLLANSTTVRLEPHAVVQATKPNDRQHPQPIELPVTISGRIDPAGDREVYEFTARKGQKLFLRLESWSVGSPLDGLLRVTDHTGKVLAEAGKGGRDVTHDPELAFTAPDDGKYHLEVGDLNGAGGPRFVYRLRAIEPDYELTLAADRFVLTPGKPLDVPVTVTRRDGFDRPVEITAEGLPEGVTVQPVQATTKDGTKPVVLRLSAKTNVIAGPMQIRGKVAGEPGLTRTARATVPGLSATTPQPWLTVAQADKPPKK